MKLDYGVSADHLPGHLVSREIPGQMVYFQANDPPIILGTLRRVIPTESGSFKTGKPQKLVV